MFGARLLAFAAALAVLIAPLAMLGAGQARAMAMAPQAITMDHCPGHSSDANHGQPCSATHCTASCTTMAVAFQAFDVYTPAPAARSATAAIFARLGRGPEFEPPPPRLA